MLLQPFDEKINSQLRTAYLQSISRPVSYDGGKTSRPRVRHFKLWEAIEPCKNPIDIISTVKVPEQNIWIWSDLHFGHNNIIKFSDRPYKDVLEMDEMLIQNFNNLVGPDDISIWVGDVSFRAAEQTRKIIYRLAGYKILVVGNHDFEKKKGLRHMAFDEVHIVYNLKIDDTHVAFTHYPMDNLPDSWVNIHGHVHKHGHHADEVKSTSHVNVNCEFIDYKPINLGTLIGEINNIVELKKQGVIKRAKIDYTEYD
jgi:calcineurin-like phosphoesterase family protein